MNAEGLVTRLICGMTISIAVFFPAVADDTIFCPTGISQREMACEQKKAFIQQATDALSKWEGILGNSSIVLMPWLPMDKAQYQAWTKPTTIFLEGKNWPVFGTYRDNDANVAYLAVHKGAYFSRAVQVSRDPGKTLDPQMEVVRGTANSDQLKSGKVRAEMENVRHERQQAYIFLAQCCGHRWTTEGPDGNGDSGPSGGGVPTGLPDSMLGIQAPISNTHVRQ